MTYGAITGITCRNLRPFPITYALFVVLIFSGRSYYVTSTSRCLIIDMEAKVLGNATSPVTARQGSQDKPRQRNNKPIYFFISIYLV